MTINAILGTKGRDIIAISRDGTVAEAVTLLAEKRIGALPVVEGSTVCGIFSERDVIYALARDGAGVLDRKVSDIMTAPAMTVGSDTAILSALSLMTRRRIRHLPVVDAGVIKGFVSIGDLVKFRIDGIEAEAAALREYIQSA
jgi:CBS domain-containing protein